MTIAPPPCLDCVHVLLGTSAGDRHDACTNLRNRAKFTSAPICRAMGWHETAAQARERGVRNSLDDNRATLLQIREGYQSDQVARRALMMGRK